MSSLGWKVEVETQSGLPHHKIGLQKLQKNPQTTKKPKIGGEAVKCKVFFIPLACHPSLQKGLWMCSMCHCSTAISVQDSMHVCRAIILSKTFLWSYWVWWLLLHQSWTVYAQPVLVLLPDNLVWHNFSQLDQRHFKHLFKNFSPRTNFSIFICHALRFRAIAKKSGCHFAL